MGHVYGGPGLRDGVDVRERRMEELVERFAVHVVVEYPGRVPVSLLVLIEHLSLLAVVDVVGRVRPRAVCHVALHELFNVRKYSCVPAQETVPAKGPDVPGDGYCLLGHRRGLVVVRKASGLPGVEKLVYFISRESCKIHLETL